MAGKNQRLQRRALLPFAIGGQAEDAAHFALQPRRQRQTGSKRKTMPQAAGREQDLGDAPKGEYRLGGRWSIPSQ